MSVTEPAAGASRIWPLLAGILLSYIGLQALLARHAVGDVAAQGTVIMAVVLVWATGAAVVVRRAFPMRWRAFAFAVALLVGVIVLWVVGFATECMVTSPCFR